MMTLICQIKMYFFIIQMMPNFWLYLYIWNLILLMIIYMNNFYNKK